MEDGGRKVSEPTETADQFEVFDCEAIFDQKLLPLVNRLIKLSKRHGIPMLASFVLAGRANGGVTCSTTWQPCDGRASENMERAAQIILGKHFPAG